MSLLPFFRLAGAKVTILFKPTRLFKIIFEFILNSPFYQFLKELIPIAGCKYKNTSSFVPNLFNAFLRLFFKALNTKQLSVKKLLLPVKELHSPVQTLHLPVKKLQLPVQTLHLPVQELHLPVQKLHLPVKKLHLPVKEFFLCVLKTGWFVI